MLNYRVYGNNNHVGKVYKPNYNWGPLCENGLLSIPEYRLSNLPRMFVRYRYFMMLYNRCA